MRVVFFGSGSFGLPVLEDLATWAEVALVVSQPDRPAGRNRVPTATPISQAALNAGLPLLRCEDVNQANARAQLEAASADAWVVIAFGQKLSSDCLAGRFAINLHASCLPRWRGASPIHHAVMYGDQETGVSVITLADQMDAGDVLAMESVAIGPTETTGELHDRLALVGPALVRRVLEAFDQDAVTPVPQDSSAVTMAPRLKRQDAILHMDMSGFEMRCMINGCAPWPAVGVQVGGKRLALMRAADTAARGVPGSLDDSGILSSAAGSVQLLEVKAEGGRLLSFDDWARGRQDSWPLTWSLS